MGCDRHCNHNTMFECIIHVHVHSLVVTLCCTCITVLHALLLFLHLRFLICYYYVYKLVNLERANKSCDLHNTCTYILLQQDNSYACINMMGYIFSISQTLEKKTIKSISYMYV